MVSALWILFDVAISLRLVFVTGRMATWEIIAWGTFGLALGLYAWRSEHQEGKRHEIEIVNLRDKLTEQGGFNRGTATAFGASLAAVVGGVTRLLELSGGPTRPTDVQEQIGVLNAELDSVALNQLTIVETPPSYIGRMTYKLKMYIHVLNDTGREILVKSPSRWNGAPLDPISGDKIPTLLQLWEAGQWVPSGPDGPSEIIVPPGRMFRFWLAFDPALGIDEIDRLRAKNRVGTFTLPIVISGRQLAWSKTV